ncbi:hypothetical protein BKA65DRAFT_583931 [Rhexocercosporidium sp. MPI-PUGE-AT-0058]|nr:hypothetical protein BKA65DRAFT_583931 [Rhexocercosporidium sp. MPI-PUGE-AT-0058]
MFCVKVFGQAMYASRAFKSREIVERFMGLSLESFEYLDVLHVYAQPFDREPVTEIMARRLHLTKTFLDVWSRSTIEKFRPDNSRFDAMIDIDVCFEYWHATANSTSPVAFQLAQDRRAIKITKKQIKTRPAQLDLSCGKTIVSIPALHSVTPGQRSFKTRFYIQGRKEPLAHCGQAQSQRCAQAQGIPREPEGCDGKSTSEERGRGEEVHLEYAQRLKQFKQLDWSEDVTPWDSQEMRALLNIAWYDGLVKLLHPEWSSPRQRVEPLRLQLLDWKSAGLYDTEICALSSTIEMLAADEAAAQFEKEKKIEFTRGMREAKKSTKAALSTEPVSEAIPHPPVPTRKLPMKKDKKTSGSVKDQAGTTTPASERPVAEGSMKEPESVPVTAEPLATSSADESVLELVMEEPTEEESVVEDGRAVA